MSEEDEIAAFLDARWDEEWAKVAPAYAHRCVYGDHWIPEYWDDEAGYMVPNPNRCPCQREIISKREILSICMSEPAVLHAGGNIVNWMAYPYQGHEDFKAEWGREWGLA